MSVLETVKEFRFTCQYTGCRDHLDVPAKDFTSAAAVARHYAWVVRREPGSEKYDVFCGNRHWIAAREDAMSNEVPTVNTSVKDVFITAETARKSIGLYPSRDEFNKLEARVEQIERQLRWTHDPANPRQK